MYKSITDQKLYLHLLIQRSNYAPNTELNWHSYRLQMQSKMNTHTLWLYLYREIWFMSKQGKGETTHDSAQKLNWQRWQVRKLLKVTLLQKRHFSVIKVLQTWTWILYAWLVISSRKQKLQRIVAESSIKFPCKITKNLFETPMLWAEINLANSIILRFDSMNSKIGLLLKPPHLNFLGWLFYNDFKLSTVLEPSYCDQWTRCTWQRKSAATKSQLWQLELQAKYTEYSPQKPPKSYTPLANNHLIFPHGLTTFVPWFC